MSKKTQKPAIQDIFDKNYIVKNGRKLPIYKCLISEQGGLISMLVVRRLPNGNFIVKLYQDQFVI